MSSRQQRSRSPGPEWSLQALSSILLWRWRTVFNAMCLSLAAATAYLLVTPSLYSAKAVVLTDTKRFPELQEMAELTIDPAIVDAQIETIRADRTMFSAIDKLGLDQSEEFVPQSGLISQVSANSSEDRGRRRLLALEQLKRKLDVRRIGRSYVAEIEIATRNPITSADIVNQIARGYITDRMGAREQVQQSSTEWMEGQLKELRHKASVSAAALAAATSPNAPPVADRPNASPTDNKATTPDSTKPTPEADREQVRLRAEIDKTNYETLLSRYTSFLQMQKLTIPTTEARVLSEATPPNRRTSPKITQTLALALLAGGALGVTGAVIAELLQRRARSTAQIEAALGVRALDVVPNRRPSDRASGRQVLSLLGGNGASEISIRDLKIAIDQSLTEPGCHVVGITSALPQEGKTTIAFNLAEVMARSGSLTLLIDGNLGNPTLARTYCDPAKRSLSHFLDNCNEVNEAMFERLPSGLMILGEQGSASDEFHPADLFGSRKMAHAVSQARGLFDFIIIDLPSMLGHAEVRAISPQIDNLIVVAEWGRVSLADIEKGLAGTEYLRERLLGVLLNKVSKVLA